MRPGTFRCATCAEDHDALDVAFAAEAPVPWLAASEEVRARSELSSDQCVIEHAQGTSFYLRGCIEIPILGLAKVVGKKTRPRHAEWGVWCSLSERSFVDVSAHWSDPERVKYGPYFGWLSTVIPSYPDTMGLKTMVHTRALGVRPRVELEATDHPLAVHQREGITLEAWMALVERLLHPEP
jgi:hypothetical protein